MVKANELRSDNSSLLDTIEKKIIAKNKEGKKSLMLKQAIPDDVQKELGEAGYIVVVDVADEETTINW